MLQDLHSFINFTKNINIYQSKHILNCYQGAFIAKFPDIKIFNEMNDVKLVQCCQSGQIINLYIVMFPKIIKQCLLLSTSQPQIFLVSRKIDKNASIITAAAVAILSALKHVKNFNSGHNKWVVVSDSMSVLSNLANNKLYASTKYIIYLIKQLWIKLFQSNIEVSSVWEPSHIGRRRRK